MNEDNEVKEMTFDDFEVHVRREIKNLLNRTNTISTFFTFDNTKYLVLKWRNTPDTAIVRFSVELDSDINTVSFTLDVNYDDGDNDHHSTGATDLPTSEEEYFQMSTVQDLGFRWEFYEYLISTFKELEDRNNV